MGRKNGIRSPRAAAAVIAALLLTVAGCAGTDRSADPPPAEHAHGKHAGHHRHATHSPTPSAKPTPTYPSGPPMLLESIAPLSGTTVGVAMPISIVFTDPVNPKARKQIEEHIRLTTSTPVVGAWHWFGDQRVDFRPRTFWKPGTRVSMVASFAHVGDGNGRYGTHSYTRDFTVGTDVRTHVYVNQHKTVVTKDGKVIRTMPSDAGSPSWPSWDGTMSVVDKERTVRMTSCSVHIACDKKDPNYYDLTLPWDVRLTWSGTFIHYSTGDPYPGHANGSHGCVHLSYKDAEWYYTISKQGDPVTITGSPRGKASGDNGYAAYELSWPQWLAESGMKQFTTSA